MTTVCKTLTRELYDLSLGGGRIYEESLSEVDRISGFIHCSTNEQLLPNLNRWYPDEDSLVVVVLDEDQVDGELLWEPGKLRPDELFPHVYGVISPDAVRAVYCLEKNDDGLFDLPEELRGS